MTIQGAAISRCLRAVEMTSSSFTVRSIQAFCFRYPLSTPVVTSFGRMLNRPAVFVRVEDEDGTIGWGEVWSNFPSNGAEHRARLVNEVLAPAAAGVAISEPSQIFEKLTIDTAVLALQSGEHGPFAQAIAGIDLAVWDLYARRSGKALWKLLGGNRNQIKVYASGINPIGSRQMAEAALEQWTSRAEIEGRFRTRDRPREPGVASLTHRQWHAGGRCQPGLVGRTGAGDRAFTLGIRSCMAGGTDPRRPAMAGVASPAEAIGRRRLPRVKTLRAVVGSIGRWAAMCCGLFSPISPNGAG